MDNISSLLRSPVFSITVIIVLILLFAWYQNPGFYAEVRDNYLTTKEVTERSDTLFLYTFPNYFTETIINRFENQFNVEVDITYYESNEEMIEQLRVGKMADIIVPTDYAIAFLAGENFLEPMNRSLLPNYKFLDGRFREMDYDYANMFSIPYFWGSVGITYNQNYVMGLPLSWSTILDPDQVANLRNRISILDDMRMTIGISLISLGYNPNTTNETEIAEATDRLLKTLPYLRSITSESLEEELINEEVVLGMNWSGSSAKGANINRDLRFILPAEGSIFFVDNLAIPINSTGKKLAFQFINYLLDPMVAAQLTNENFFANPVTYSRRYINRLILKGPAYKNPFLSKNIYIIEDVGEATSLYQKYWSTFKDSANTLLKDEIRIERAEERILLF